MRWRLDLTLTPGMSAEVFIRTTDRTVLYYLMKPIRNHVQHVFGDNTILFDI